MERRGSDVSLKSTSSEKLCCTLYENNANFSSDSIASSHASSFDLDLYNTNGQTDNSKERKEVDGVFDAIIYIGK